MILEIYNIPSTFLTLFIVVDPLGLIPVFIIYLAGYSKAIKKRVIFKSIFISIAVSVFFIFFGQYLLKFIGVSTGSFLVAGGILLFLIAIDMLLGKPSRVKMRDAELNPEEEDVSVFPLAIPMLCGPGNIAALLMFSTQADSNIVHLAVISAVSASVFFIALVIMFFSQGISRLLGTTGISIVQRLSGLILSALSVQFIANGLHQIGIIQL